MPVYSMQTEDIDSLIDPTQDDIRQAVERMASPTGPTFIVINADADIYVQAAGTNGRYVIESRQSYGEGFTHYRVASCEPTVSVPTVVSYKNKCNKHPPRSCPIHAQTVDIVGLPEVLAVMLDFHRLHERSPAYFWRDVTAEIEVPEVTHDDDAIQQISPSGVHGSNHPRRCQ